MTRSVLCAAALMSLAPSVPAEARGPSAEVGFDYYPASKLADPGDIPTLDQTEIQVSKLGASLGYPVMFREGKTVLENGLKYQVLLFDYTGFDDVPGGVELNKAHSIQYEGVYTHALTQHWEVLVLAVPGIASDLEGSFGIDDMTLQGGAAGLYNFSEHFRVGLGAAWDLRFGEGLPLPLLLIEWNNGKNMLARLLAPQVAEFAWRPVGWFEIGAVASVEGSSYHGDPDKYLDTDNPQLRYSLGRVGLRTGFLFFPWLRLDIDGGATLLRRFEFFDGTDERASYNLEQTPFLGVTLRGGAIGP